MRRAARIARAAWRRLGAARSRPEPVASPEPEPAPGPVELLNRAPNPRLLAHGGEGEIVSGGVRVVGRSYLDDGDAGVYVHVHARAVATTHPLHEDRIVAAVTGAGTNLDSHISPGGRNHRVGFRLGMRTGVDTTVAVSVFLDRPLIGLGATVPLRAIVGVRFTDGRIVWNFAESAPARNEYGDHRISVTFRLPEEIDTAWVRLLHGAPEGCGVSYWHSLSVTESPQPVEYFDGTTAADGIFSHSWQGSPDESASVRRLSPSLERRELMKAPAALAAAGQITEARGLLAHIESSDKTDEVSLVARARLEVVLGHDRAADDLLRRAASLPTSTGAGRVAEAERELGASHWARAERALRAAIDAGAREPENYYNLALSVERQGRLGELPALNDAGLALDEPPFPVEEMLAAEPKRFAPRRIVGQFVHDNLDVIRRMADQRTFDDPTSLDLPVFVFWAQGVESAPPIVQRCVARLRERFGDRLHVLTQASIAYYVDIPADMLTALQKNRAHLSDVLRLYLLERYGGIWIDATCFATGDIVVESTKLLESGDLFAFRYGGGSISSWFLAARPGSYAVRMWRAALVLWWEREGRILDYFLLHRFFEALWVQDQRFHDAWEAAPDRRSKAPHELQMMMLEPFDRVTFARLASASFVHKLTYKHGAVRANSFLAHIVRGDFEE